MKATASRKRAAARWSLLLTVPVIVVLNPLVVWLVADVGKLGLVYTGLADAWFVAIIVCAIRYLRARGRFRTLVVSLMTFLPVMLVAELGLVKWQFARRVERRQDPLAVAHPRLGWTLDPNSEPHHVAPGSFDVHYQIDEIGRRATTNIGELPTLHFFGDSMLFGWGVGNADTALQLLARDLSTYRVQNWAVPGFGIEQMYVRLLLAGEHIEPGDRVVFGPTSYDLERNLVHKRFVCAHAMTNDVEMFPKLDGEVEARHVSDECSLLHDTLLLNSKMPLGSLYGAAWDAASRRELLDNADRLFSLADGVARSRGADFSLVFVVSPRECQSGALAFPLDGLRTPHRSLLDACPREVTDLGFGSDDSHWSVAGNRWAANELLALFRGDVR